MTSNVLHDDDDDVIMVSDNRETITDVENDIRALRAEFAKQCADGVEINQTLENHQFTLSELKKEYERAERNRQEFEQLNMKFMELEKKAWPLSGMTVEQRDKIMRKLKEKRGIEESIESWRLTNYSSAELYLRYGSTTQPQYTLFSKGSLSFFHCHTDEGIKTRFEFCGADRKKIVDMVWDKSCNIQRTGRKIWLSEGNAATAKMFLLDTDEHALLMYRSAMAVRIEWEKQ